MTPPSWDEAARLRALADYRILDTPKEEEFEDIARMAAEICHAPISVINFIADKRQWFKAEIGLGVRETPLDISICARAILQPGIFTVPDLSVDPRFGHNPLVAGEPKLRFYAGALLETDEGLPLGTLCVLDYKPRILTERESFALKTLARHVMAQLNLRRANAMLADKAVQLEEVVKRRTAKLEETVSELESLSYSIAHDMRAPLRAMQGYAEALLQEYLPQLDATGQHYVDRILRGSNRLDLLIRDILAYSRVIKQDVQLKPVNLEPLLAEIVHNYPEFGAGRLQLTLGPLPPVLAHEALLTQIASNLLGNAVKFAAPDRPAALRIRAEEADGQVRLWFEDNGIGIAPEHFHRVFQIFGRVHPDAQYPGTGIGLAIVKKAAERMGGAAGVESEPGKGSRFWITLRRA